ncbi:MAG: hypothetical protein HC769_20040 [Cyanobacteria bacterium CRU_2_1]|nr:hypothetical protein [Cyanobacteria bacterium CRU_2_1]
MAGDGGEDNAAFRIQGNRLVVKRSFDFERKRSYGVRIRTTDPDNAFVEQSFTIRVKNVSDSPSPTPIKDGDGTRGSATDLGALSGVLFRSSRIGSPLRKNVARAAIDQKDYYVFDLKSSGSLTVSLSRLRADANLEIFNSAGRSLGRSNKRGRANESIALNNASAGIHYVLVSSAARAQTRYLLSLSTISSFPAITPLPVSGLGGGVERPVSPGGGPGGGSPSPSPSPNPNPSPSPNPNPSPSPNPTPAPVPVDPNGTFASAFDVGGPIPTFDSSAGVFADPTQPFIYDGDIGGTYDYGVDENDYYKVTLSTDSYLAISVNGLTADANLELYDGSNLTTPVDSSINYDSQPDIVGAYLGVGTHYIRLSKGFNAAQTNYDLAFMAHGLEDGFGSVTQDLDLFSGSTITTNGSIDFTGDNDFYQFRLNPFFLGVSVSIRLTNLASDADILVYDSAFKFVGRSAAGDTTAEDVTLTNTSGLRLGETYFVQVKPYQNNTPTYTVELSATF